MVFSDEDGILQIAITLCLSSIWAVCRDLLEISLAGLAIHANPEDSYNVKKHKLDIVYACDDSNGKINTCLPRGSRLFVEMTGFIIERFEP